MMPVAMEGVVVTKSDGLGVFIFLVQDACEKLNLLQHLALGAKIPLLI